MTPPSRVHHGVWAARGLTHVPSPVIAARELGNGRNTSAHDTVPYALWAARNLGNFEQAIWTTPTSRRTGPLPASHCQPGLGQNIVIWSFTG
jgi:hypothetical protein